MHKKLLLLFLFFPLLILAQNDTIIKGRIVSDLKDLEGVHIINITNIAGAVSDNEGYFSIKAKTSDTLLFSAVFLEKKKHIITKEEIKQKLILVPIAPSTESLREVVITEYPNINAVSLGIVPANIKTYTKAERKLIAAGVFKWYSPLLIPLGGMSVDGLINAISGRTNMLEKELVVERKEFLQEKTLDYFDDEYLMKTLNIPEEYVDGFIFYVVEDVPFSNAMKVKNKTQATFLIHQLAVEFLELKEIPLKPEDRKSSEVEQIKEDKDEN
ncbi:hypothetical protein ACFO3U_03620 [Flavobacterium ponti]|uniref:Carboxypeptidase-like regulatory domain-containing protein n=1 Tax=Flavobacterium ponti TaxID=665133 RepID=A0ABV9P457_9FLAO